MAALRKHKEWNQKCDGVPLISTVLQKVLFETTDALFKL